MEVIEKIGEFIVLESKPQASTWMFNLFYMASVYVFATATIVSTAEQYVGDPINCLSSTSGKLEHDERRDSFCYFLFTYTINHNDFMKLDKSLQMYPGVANENRNEKSYERTYQHFYLWVPLLLLGQTVSFYLPRVLWNCWDSSVLDILLDGLWKRKTISLEEKEKNKLNEVHSFFVGSLHSNNSWAIRFYACEVLTLIIAGLNFGFTDIYLGGEFASLGWDSLSYAMNSNKTHASPLERVFPKMTKCEYRKYSPGGLIDTEDLLCVMAVNNIYQKIYVALNFYLKVLILFCAAALLLRIAVLYSSSVRFMKLGRPGVQVSDKVMATLEKHLHHGDWLMLLSIGDNLDHITYGYLLAQIDKTMETWSPESGDIEMPTRRSAMYPTLPRDNLAIVDGVPTEETMPPPYHSVDTLPVQPRAYPGPAMSDSEGFASGDDLLR